VGPLRARRVASGNLARELPNVDRVKLWEAELRDPGEARNMTSTANYWSRVGAVYASNVAAYLRDAASPLTFLQVMRVRLSQSKLGKLACPRPITPKLHLRTFGKEPLSVRSHTTDISVLNEILVSAGYDCLLRHPLKDPGLIIDLGANIGLVDRWLLNQYPRAEIIAVEPEPGNAATLRTNVEGLPVTIIEACVGASARTVTLHTSSGEHGFTMVGDAPRGTRTFQVPVITMETVAPGRQPISLLKVDIEGAEEELFADCSGWIDRVEVLLIECHGTYTLDSLKADLARAGADFVLRETDMKPGLEVGLLTRA
jgi:FkbM family methyltransferase